MGMTGLPPVEFSLISTGTKNPGQVNRYKIIALRKDGF